MDSKSTFPAHVKAPKLKATNRLKNIITLLKKLDFNSKINTIQMMHKIIITYACPLTNKNILQ